jgi:predicted Zn-dependent protease
MNAEEFQKQCEAVEGYTALGLLDEASDLLEELPAEFKITREVITLHMGILLAAGEFLKASYLAETLCRLNPGHTERLIEVAQYRHKGGQPESALAWLKSIEDKCDHDARFHFLRAQCLAALGNTEGAKEELVKVFAIDERFKLRANEDPAFEAIFGQDPTS